MKPIIEIQHIRKQYKLGGQNTPYITLREAIMGKNKTRKASDFWALNDVSFNVMPGDSVGIIGNNGAGKSTLLKILSRITPPTTGKIITRGRIASLLEVGTGFHSELSGLENIYLNGSILGLRNAEIKKKLDEIIDFSGVEKFINTPLKHYSSGMQLRLAFAVAAHLEPEILIIDEVLAVGDAEFQKKSLGKMEDVTKQGRTVLFVSHNMSAVNSLCRTGVLLEKGEVLLSNDIKSVITTYTGSLFSLHENNYSSTKAEGIFFKSIAFLNRSSNVFLYSKTIQIELELVNLHSSQNLNIGIAIKNKWGQKLSTSVKSYRPELNNSLKIRFTIPSQILLHGNYSIDMAIFNNILWEYLSDVIRFEIIDNESEFSIYNNSEIGNVNIKCKWDVVD